MPHSEVCLSMQIAGKYMDFEVRIASVQLFVTDDSTPRYSQHFSSTITMGEAGVKTEDDELYYLPHGIQLPNDPLADEPPV